MNKAVEGLSGLDSHLVEVEGDTLCLYGSGALESLDRNWSVQTAGGITTVFFVFIDFDDIVPALPKLKIKFPNFLVRCFLLSFQHSVLSQEILLPSSCFSVFQNEMENTVEVWSVCPSVPRHSAKGRKISYSLETCIHCALSRFFSQFV